MPVKPVKAGLYIPSKFCNSVSKMRDRLTEAIIERGQIEFKTDVLELGTGTDIKTLLKKVKPGLFVRTESVQGFQKELRLEEVRRNEYDTVLITHSLSEVEPGNLEKLLRQVADETRWGGIVVITDFFIPSNEVEVRKTKSEFRYHMGDNLHRIKSLIKIANECGFVSVKFQDDTESVRNFYHKHFKKSLSNRANWARYNLNERVVFGSLILRRK